MLDLLWKTGFYEIWNGKIFLVCELDFDKNECENECIIIRKWLDSEKTVDLWGVWGLLLVVWWWNGGFVGSWNEYFGSKMGRLPKSFPKDFGWFFMDFLFGNGEMK